MDKNIYILLNDIDSQAEGYGELKAGLADVKKWKKRVTKQRKNSGWMKYAAAAVCICVLGAAVSPVGQNVYAQVSAAIYNLSKMLGIQKDLSDYRLVVGETVEKDGISATLNDVIVDGETLLVSYFIQSEKPLDPAEMYPDVFVTINSAQASFAVGGFSETPDEYSMAVSSAVEIPGIDPAEQIDMELDFYVGEKKLGSVAFTASGAALLADTKTVELNKSFTLPDGAEIMLQKYTTSNVGQKIYFTTSNNKCEYDFMLKGTDNLGNNVEFSMRSFLKGQGRLEISTIKNGFVDERAEELNVTLYAAEFPKESGKMNDNYEPLGEEFTITLP